MTQTDYVRGAALDRPGFGYYRLRCACGKRILVSSANARRQKSCADCWRRAPRACPKCGLICRGGVGLRVHAQSHKDWPPEKVARMQALRDAGATLREVGEAVGCDYRQAWKVLQRAPHAPRSAA